MIVTVIQAVTEKVTDKVTEIAAEYRRMMYALALSILKDEQYAEDAVQEALLKISQNEDSIDGIKTNRSRNYVYTVTKNMAISIARKYFSSNDVTTESLSALNNIEGDIDIRAFSDKYGFSLEIGDALEKLDEIDKDIICYKYGAGYSSKEIAELTGLKPATVRKRLQRALDSLQNIINDERKEG